MVRWRGRAGLTAGESNVASSGPSPGVELWTGIKKGPPRKLKFPEPQEVIEKLKKYLL